jgi:drug/metabolite transporter (DMT)-like permease
MAANDQAPALPRPGRSLMFGYVCGATMALGAAISFASARAGILGGLGAEDMIFARYVVAGLVLLPALIVWGLPTLAGIGWKRGLILTLTGGPLFALLQTGGYTFAPLAHGAVIAPSTVTILSTVAAGAFLGERLTRSHFGGAVLVLAGILLIGWHGLTGGGAGNRAWIGDLLFVASSILWTAFTVLIRYWKVDAVRATAVVSVLSLAVVVPVYFAWHGVAHLAALPTVPLIVQGLVQGLVQSIVTLMAYSRAIAILGVSRAVLFPAIVPAISILIGIPLIGEVPTSTQVVGLALVSLGLFIAIGLLYRLIRPHPPTPPARNGTSP